MPRNMELKARLADFESACRTAKRLATDHLGRLNQVDTYFHCRLGRLKLREIAGQTAELISYQRSDQREAKGSDYQILACDNPKQLKTLLTNSLGQWLCVEKTRDVYLFQNVRIHLDRVAQLGDFLEFEAVLNPQIDDAEGRLQIDYLVGEFALGESDLEARSYSDLLNDRLSERLPRAV